MTKNKLIFLITIFILSLLSLFLYKKTDSVTISTSDWKSYQNQEFGFSYKLPESFSEYQKIEEYLSQYLSVNSFKTSDYQAPLPKNGYGLIVSVKNNACDQVSNNKTSSFKYQLSTINNLKLQKFLLKGDSVYTWNALIDLKDSCLAFSLDVGLNDINNDNEQLFSQIVSSLEFFQSTDSISSQELVNGWYWAFENQRKTNTPENWVFKEAGRSSCWHSPDKECRF